MRTKEQLHKERTKNKAVEKAYSEAVTKTCRLVLLFAYASLVECFDFDMKQLGVFRKRMDRYSVYIRDKLCDEQEMAEVLLKKGIDVYKIGDEEEGTK